MFLREWICSTEFAESQSKQESLIRSTQNPLVMPPLPSASRGFSRHSWNLPPPKDDVGFNWERYALTGCRRQLSSLVFPGWALSLHATGPLEVMLLSPFPLRNSSNLAAHMTRRPWSADVGRMQFGGLMPALDEGHLWAHQVPVLLNVA